ncbi:MAG: NAD(P)-dependent oxidoreductase [Rhodobacteraceae bacterium]|nr:NAD(P)-dependent oxidoreductase [Paracoccaceae bacterium]
MSLAITGATGLVGRFFVEAALAQGTPVTVLGRTPPPRGFFPGVVAHRHYRLGERPDLTGHSTLIHCALAHLPGRYRGGEGDDPEGFTRLNLDGSATLFQAARDSGVARLIFVSSRAVYGAYPPGTTLHEDLALKPDTLYGRIKAQAEDRLFALASPDFSPTALRATGIYGPPGPGQRHKWADLFDAFRAGQPIAPRRGTELHGADLAAAAHLIRSLPPETTGARAFNLSDIVLDRHDLLTLLARDRAIPHPPPPRATTPLSLPNTERMRALGWQPRGRAGLIATLPLLH